MTTPAMPICLECSRFHGEPDEPFAPWTCSAFPNGIPKSIINSEEDHTKPIAGDNDLQFDPVEPARRGEITRNAFLVGEDDHP